MVDRTSVFTRVQQVFAEFFGDDEIKLESTSTAGDIEGWDSLATVELMIELEREFGIRFHTGEMAGLKNVGELVDQLLGKLQ